MQHGNLSMLGKTIQCGDFKRMVHAFYQNKKTPLDKPVSEFQKAFTACRLELRAHFDDSKLNAIEETIVEVINKILVTEKKIIEVSAENLHIA